MINMLPTPPHRSDPTNFAERADAFLSALPSFANEANALAAAMNLNSTTGTSASSVTIGIGTKIFIVSEGMSWQPGMFLVIADTAQPSTNSMFGQVESYTSTTLVVKVGAILGSGTKAAWLISQSSPTVDIPTPLQQQTYTAFTTTGAAPAYLVTTVPAAGLTTNTRFRLKMHAANAGAACTLSVNGSVATGIKQYDATGAKVDPLLAVNQLLDVEFDGVHWVVLDPLPQAQTPYKDIQSITATVASNALTITLPPAYINFRSSSLGNGTSVTRNITSTLTITVPSGATLGTTSSAAARLAVLAVDNAGAVQLAVVNMAGGKSLDETGLISTSAISASATSSAVCYSTTAVASAPYRVVGFIDITEGVAGTWAASPTIVQGNGGQAMAALQTLGYWQTWSNLTGSRLAATTYYNTTGRPIVVRVYFSMGSLQYTINGTALGFGFSAANGNTQTYADQIVPPGASYSASNAGTYWYELR